MLFSGQEGTAAQTVTRHVYKLTVEAFLINVLRPEARCPAWWCHPSSSSLLNWNFLDLCWGTQTVFSPVKSQTHAHESPCVFISSEALQGVGGWGRFAFFCLCLYLVAASSVLSPEKQNSGLSHSRILSGTQSYATRGFLNREAGEGAETQQLGACLYEAVP